MFPAVPKQELWFTPEHWWEGEVLPGACEPPTITRCTWWSVQGDPSPRVWLSGWLIFPLLRENAAVAGSEQPASALGSSVFTSSKEAVRGICTCAKLKSSPTRTGAQPLLLQLLSGYPGCFEMSIQQASLAKLRHRAMLWP